MATPRRRKRQTSAGAAARTGAGLATRRLQLGMTQAELADLAGVSRSSVQSIEAGRETVQLDRVLAITDTLGCELSLTTRSGTPILP